MWTSSACSEINPEAASCAETCMHLRPQQHVAEVQPWPCALLRVMETDWVKESKVMLDFIEKLKRGEPIMQATSAAPQQTGYGAPAPAPRVSPGPTLHKSCCLPLMHGFDFLGCMTLI